MVKEDGELSVAYLLSQNSLLQGLNDFSFGGLQNLSGYCSEG
jgi:hypothetical protein